MLSLPCPLQTWFKFDGDFRLSDGRPVVLNDELSGSPNDTGNFIWNGSVTMSKFIDLTRQKFHAQSVLELGAGRSGLAGITAAMCGAAVVLTDLEYCSDGLRKVIEINAENITGSAKVGVLDWNHGEIKIEGNARGIFSMIIAADVVWLSELVPPLLRTLNRFSLPGTRIFLAHQSRSVLVDEMFFSGMQGLRFSAELVYREGLVGVWEFSRS